jgi:hypothetical protein
MKRNRFKTKGLWRHADHGKRPCLTPARRRSADTRRIAPGCPGLEHLVAERNADLRIRVLSIHPATIQTAMIDRAMAANPAHAAAIATMQPVGRVGQPRDIAAVVVFLCSDGASFMRAATSSSTAACGRRAELRRAKLRRGCDPWRAARVQPRTNASQADGALPP